ncbi:PIN domain-containing protein [Bacillus tropicus]|uniref:PIN domain-containing protein n=1 Tax=Bacillus tropicus TaxID=2026188 RepID=UPI003D190254
MHIFLDTNLLFTDPFFRGNYNKQLINLIEKRNEQSEHREEAECQLDLKFEEEEIKLYMSRVVFEETKNHYINYINETFKQIREIDITLSKYMDMESFVGLNKQKEDAINYFDTYYQNLIDDKILVILEHPQNVVDDLVSRAVKKLPPFFNDKNEFRDAIIWLTYAGFVEEQDLENCYFLSNNIKDFCQNTKKKRGNDKQDTEMPLKLHPNLIVDSERFTLYRNVQGLFIGDATFKEFNEENRVLQQRTTQIEKMFHIIESIDADFILNGLNTERDNYDLIDDVLSNYISTRLDVDQVYDDVNYGGYLKPTFSWNELQKAEIIDKEIFDNEVVVSANLIQDYTVEIILYNPIDDNTEESVGEAECTFEIPITFTVNENLEIKQIEAENPYLLK